MSGPVDPRLAPSGWWQCRALQPDGTWAFHAVVESARHPAGTRAELTVGDARMQIGDDAVCVAGYDDERRVHSLLVSRRSATKAPPMWFAEIRESTARPPAAHLVAFTEHGMAEGTLLDEVGLADVDVVTTDQLGAVRWYPATGEIDQIYVAPDWRRRRVASGLIAAAATLSVARDWSRPWGDGQRTELGEKLRAAAPWRARGAPLTHVAPPMTPDTPGR